MEVEIAEALWAAHPEDIEVGQGLGRALINLSRLLSEAGQTDEEERACRRLVEFFETLWKADPENVRIGSGLDKVLNNLGHLLQAADQVREAEQVYRRAVKIAKPCGRPNRGTSSIGQAGWAGP